MSAKMLTAIVKEIEYYSENINEQQIKKVAHLCHNAQKIFVAGSGRSGFAARGFANRLMQLGMQVYFVGETTTPSIQKHDLLLIGSGSGSTSSLVNNAQKAKESDAYLATLTIYRDATIGQISDAIIEIPGGTPKNNSTNQDTAKSIQPMGTLFEQLSWLTYDAIILELIEMTNQTAETMFARHANLE